MPISTQTSLENIPHFSFSERISNLKMNKENLSYLDPLGWRASFWMYEAFGRAPGTLALDSGSPFAVFDSWWPWLDYIASWMRIFETEPNCPLDLICGFEVTRSVLRPERVEVMTHIDYCGHIVCGGWLFALLMWWEPPCKWRTSWFTWGSCGEFLRTRVHTLLDMAEHVLCWMYRSTYGHWIWWLSKIWIGSNITSVTPTNPKSNRTVNTPKANLQLLSNGTPQH